MYPSMQDEHQITSPAGTPQPTAPPPPLPPTSSPLPYTATTVGPTSYHFYPPSVPVAFPVQQQIPVPWSTGLFDCCDDIGNCCVTCFCPCITFGQVAEIIDRGSISCGASCALYAMLLCVTGCNCLYSCFYRSKMRGQYLLEEAPCVDCVVHCCCESCALCQEYRELKNHGFDLHLGWHGTMARNGSAMLPPSFGGMTR